MREAIRIANESRERGDYAFGAVLVRDGKIVTASGNKVITYRDPTGHAELNCLRKAAMREGHRHLKPGAVLYTTHAPCPMCLGACVWIKISGLVYGAYQRDIAAWARNMPAQRIPGGRCLLSRKRCTGSSDRRRGADGAGDGEGS